MSQNDPTSVTVLGLGAMGTAIAGTLITAGHATTLWNRSPGKADDLVARGASRAGTVAEAVSASDVVIVCLLDQASVHDVLDPVAGPLSGRTVVNLTTTSPAQARDLATWAADRNITYLDGGMMAVPQMIGQPGSLILYSGSPAAFEAYRPVLDLLGDSRFFGADAGLASLYDLALLSAMYAMFTGFFHGAAMVGSEGGSAAEFAEMAAPWITAMTGALPYHAGVIDKGNYRTDTQSLDFNKSALDMIVRASRDQGVGVDVMAPIKALIDGQVSAGHGADSFVRIFEGIRKP
ncbi:NAD(P)-binding domain-containing protein [Micromonospora sp. CPCC 205371]|nr:NAD(P)-binding domain-containing protein [Micromonospora sp. CPCC 205371]